MLIRNTKNLKDKFFEKIQKTDSCWFWLGYIDKNGYGRLSYDYHHIRMNRYSYEIHKGEVPQGMLVCHTCDNPRCVNPDHLFLGTHKDNVQDMINKNRRFKLQLGGKPPITKELIASIRLALANKIKKTVIKSRYNVCISTIRNIEMCRGRYKNESN